MGYSDEIWYVGSGGHKYYTPGLSSQNAHIQQLICLSVITKKEISRALPGIPQKAAHAVYSMNIASM